MMCSSINTKTLIVVVAALLLGSGCRVSEVRPTGSWELIKEGTYESVDWKLFATEPDGEGRCINLETEAEIELSKDLGDDLYRGRVPACLFTPRKGSTGRYARAVQSMHYGSLESGQRNYGFIIGLADPAVKSLTVRFDRGDQLVVDTSDGFIVALFDASLSPREMLIKAHETVVNCEVELTSPPSEVVC